MAKFNGFSGDYVGLTIEQVQEQHEKYGYNELKPAKKRNFFFEVLIILREPMFLLLICTSLIYFVLGEPRDGIIMLVFVAFMLGINIFQEWRTDKTIQALKDLSSPKIKVIRNSEIIEVETREVATGDLMIFEEGDRISADGKILEMFDLGVDESTLTGESETVWKKVTGNDSDKENYWKRNYCYSGTTVIQGSAIVEVTSVGASTEYGKIGAALVSVSPSATPLEKQTRKLIKVCALIGIGLFILVTVFTFYSLGNNTEITDIFDRITHSIIGGITLAMAIIPEEFPVILTVFLAMGAARLAKKNALIRRIPAVETLGAVTVLCVDKTGTLTQNKMTVQETFTLENNIEDLKMHSVLGCENQPYDPIEKAILAYANEGDYFNKVTKLVSEYPFSSEKKMMGHIWEIDGRLCLAAKGSPESILQLCVLSEEDLGRITDEQIRQSELGYRVIAVAKKCGIEQVPGQIEQNKLEFLGLIGMKDPPREDVPDAIKKCTKAGIRVVMITGDNGITAQSIARMIGIQNPDNILTGIEIDEMTNEELMKACENTNIFSRVIPNHKMRIVKAFKDAGEIVAMGGDGVNDAPALKLADIGVAMGLRGTNVAKEAADMVLLDDNFTTIVETVKDGRRIFDNIKKAIGYVFTIHIPIVLIALMCPLLGIPVLLLPIHIVLLELIIDPTCSIVFERHPAERNIMDRKPRSPKESLASRDVLVKSFLQGLAIFAAAFISYIYLMNDIGWPQGEAASFALTILVFANLFLVYINSSETDSVVSRFLRKNRIDTETGKRRRIDKVVIGVNIGIVAALLFIVYVPYGNIIAKTVALPLNAFVTAVVIAFAATVWWEIVKLVRHINRHIKRRKARI
jgi:Ca2+-transporting ATPase